MKLPRHISLTIEHNDHRTNFESVEIYLLTRGDHGPDFESEEAKQRSIETNDLWTIQWFPDTPNGSIYLAAPTLDELLVFALKVEEDQSESAV